MKEDDFEYKKVSSVIDSCKSIDHIKIASKYIDLFIEKCLREEPKSLNFILEDAILSLLEKIDRKEKEIGLCD